MPEFTPTTDLTLDAIGSMLDACERHIESCRIAMGEIGEQENKDMPEVWINDVTVAANKLHVMRDKLLSHARGRDRVKVHRAVDEPYRGKKNG